jgi:asparagine N-glycosylation enzyme membrane subunit Stt3
MKTSMKLKLVWSTLALFFFNIALYAQDKKLDVDVNVGKSGGSQWYTNPVVWIIGAAVFILLLVALLRGRSRD